MNRATLTLVECPEKSRYVWDFDLNTALEDIVAHIRWHLDARSVVYAQPLARDKSVEICILTPKRAGKVLKRLRPLISRHGLMCAQAKTIKSVDKLIQPPGERSFLRMATYDPSARL